MGRVGLGAHHLLIATPKLRIHTLVVRLVIPRKGAIFMVPRPNLGGDSIFSLPRSTQPRRTLLF